MQGVKRTIGILKFGKSMKTERHPSKVPMKPTLPDVAARKGLTLVEMIMVVVMLALVAGVITPRITSTLGFNDLKLESQRVKAKLIYAQQAAIDAQRRYRIVFDKVNDAMILRYSPQDNATFNDIMTIPLERGIVIDSTTFATAGADTVEFDTFGSPLQAGQVVLRSPDGSTQTVEVLPVTGKVEIP